MHRAIELLGQTDAALAEIAHHRAGKNYYTFNDSGSDWKSHFSIAYTPRAITNPNARNCADVPTSRVTVALDLTQSSAEPAYEYLRNHAEQIERVYRPLCWIPGGVRGRAKATNRIFLWHGIDDGDDPEPVARWATNTFPEFVRAVQRFLPTEHQPLWRFAN